MTPLTAKEIKGNWATLLLPIQADDSIDFALLATELDHFIAAKVNGVYSNGSAGEFYTQSEDEFDRVSQLLAEKCTRANVPFQIGLSHTSAQQARERLRRTRSLKPSAYQVILPDWFPPSMPEILAFLEKMVAEAGSIPLILYNPPHAKRKLSPVEWATITERVPGVVGMKVPGGDDAWYAAMQPVMEKLSVFIPGHLLADGLTRGGHGAYSNVACLNPAAAQRWYELCVKNPAAGAAQGKRILAFWSANIAPIITRDGLSNMAADKAAAFAGGWLPSMSTRLRWPYRYVPEAQARAIGEVARAELPEFF
ncbi:dihydrodipicolinate synthase family protein [Oleiharenicola lentus]|uniref:dihydrodipicolinate synthase family protein n=1 Tax=Oleiharenicola lentus TaxID=2508720 RepID=UPI003F66C899